MIFLPPHSIHVKFKFQSTEFSVALHLQLRYATFRIGKYAGGQVMSSRKMSDTESLPCSEEFQSKALGRKRCPVAHQNILCAARALLSEIGFADLTIEGIAERAGVGKTTIYRRWPNKASVVLDAFIEAANKAIPFSDTGRVQEDLRLQMRRLVKLMNGVEGRTIATLIGGAQADAELAKAFRSRWLAARREEARQIIARGKANGEIRANIDPEVLLDALYGPLYFRLLIGHAPLTPSYADKLVNLVMSGLNE
jgi:AcrR family transcriptional regulator